MNRWLLPSLHFLSKSQVPLASLFEGFLNGHGRSSTQVKQIHWYHVRMSSNRNSFNGFRTYCSGRDLAAKKCVPCNSKDIRAMTEESANEMMPKVAGWNLVNEDGTLKLNRSWKVKSFTKGLELFQLVGNVAEAEDHHPDLHLVGWNNVKIEIWTHSVVCPYVYKAYLNLPS
ncbi:pterin-4-alpha-carbinolamine dehydratase 2, mitochondrial isoform X2 [Jatropha curcas]|uniref:pterin-4-alpha-carbinolamine dehydratase 2, mitochondrial isoform X2 n=1 Tax=Jatropha curcas TaxID=180498 RepID=UPI0005FAC06E|nr:pterin-4-alpha-carbinolamine dehydratase 2, mitochondrial isoform X2 [Jatropha curcas]